LFLVMHADNGDVDHLDGGIMGACQGVHDLGPHARSSPANETIVASRVRTEVERQVAPWRPRSQDPEDAIEARRSFTRGTPRGLFGNIGLIAAHSSAVSS
jgi:hypothetical protein